MTAPNEVDQDAAARAAQLDPDAQLDLLDRELARRRAERAAGADRAKAAGGPCSRCGAVESWQAPGRGGWAGGDQHGAVCHPCDRERGGPSGDDREHRIRAARQVLGQTPAPPWAGHGSEPAARYWHDDYLADAMPWWHEVPGRPAVRRPRAPTPAALQPRPPAPLRRLRRQGRGLDRRAGRHRGPGRQRRHRPIQPGLLPPDLDLPLRPR